MNTPIIYDILFALFCVFGGLAIGYALGRRHGYSNAVKDINDKHHPGGSGE